MVSPLILKQDIKEVDIAKIKKALDAEPFVKETEYIDPEKAAAEFQEAIGEDFVKFIGDNPLKPSIDVKLNAAYANADSLKLIHDELMENSKIHEVFYKPNLIKEVNQNMSKISLYLLGFSALLLVIAMALINNTIRLSI